jgi:hypothetical protein
MTGLVFVLAPEYVLVGMDSLALYGDDKTPFKYCTKLFGLPHLAALVCATGSLQLGLNWYLDIQSNIVAADIDYLNGVAATRLRMIAERLSEPVSSTVYHFGFSPRAEAFTGIAFRSESGFAPENLAYGLGVKPPFQEAFSAAVEDIALLGPECGVARILQRLRAGDDALPVAERVGIGGQAHLMTLSGSRQVTHVVDCWPDYEVQFHQMMRSLRKRNAGRP